MDAKELKRLVATFGRSAIREGTGWSRWTLRRKLAGLTEISKSEAIALRVVAATLKKGMA